ncbi:hypothetical protein ACIGB8_28385 [Promicromonospora sukumoe]|uniref:hypothetical protein n=1 Tax=Promicromonospora sukumoe TaxID=88382 RepID=UPI0037CBD99F
MNPTPQHDLDASRWASTFPWLELAPEERETLGRLSDPELDQLAVSIARRALENEADTP